MGNLLNITPADGFIEFKKEEVDQSIPDRFQQQVEKYPNRIAVKTENYEFTYHELNEAANCIARAILAQSENGQEQIALLLENDAPMIAAMMGVLKSGKTYVPLDPSLPRARTTYILEDSQASLIVTNDKNLSLVQELTHQNTLPLVNIDQLDSGLSAENPGLSISPDTFTWILYTSGSTGQPKGGLQTHRNVLHYVMNYTNGFHICADDRYVLIYSCSVNAGAHVIYSALLNGASLYPMDIRTKGLDRLADWLIQQEITLYSSVPTVFSHFTHALTGEEEFPKLRLIKMMGEPVHKRHVELFKKHFSESCTFVNRLGSTETGSIRWNFIDKKTSIADNNVPVGYPVADNEILMLNDDGEEVAPGEVGEISVRSPYLSPGYWRKPERTQAAFLPDPEGGVKRIYRTGDLGRMLPDGCLVHLGRKDFQIKIRGYRIELGEVEAAMLNHDKIKDAAAWGHEDQSGDKRLVGYLAPAGKQLPSVKELRQFLGEKLPEYMIPSIFVKLDALPLAPNGKLNYRALPAPDTARPELLGTFVAPRDELETELTNIWEKVLGIQPVGIEDGFFELGGNSLLAVKMFNRIRNSFDRNLPLSILLQASNIEQLAHIIREKEQPLSQSLLVAIQPNGSRPPFFGVHGCDGEVLFYNNMARYLGSEQPFYALMAQGLNGEEISNTRIEDMAAHYVREMQTIQPEGAYYLGGAGVGGMVAFEMAQQLLAQGQKIALLVLIDTAPPRPVSSGVNTSVSRKPLGHYIFRSIHHMQNGQLIRTTGNLLRRHYSKIARISIPRRTRKIRDVMEMAPWRYVPQIYPGRITYLLSEERRRASDNPRDAVGTWYDLTADGIDIMVIPGGHHSIWKEPNVQVMGEKLKACLDEVQVDGSTVKR